MHGELLAFAAVLAAKKRIPLDVRDRTEQVIAVTARGMVFVERKGAFLSVRGEGNAAEVAAPLDLGRTSACAKDLAEDVVARGA